MDRKLGGIAIFVALVLGCGQQDKPAESPVVSQPIDETPHRLSVARDANENPERRIGFAQAIVRESKDAAAIEEAKLIIAEIEKQGKWAYSSSLDPMTKKESKSATLTSSNTLNFDRPYDGEQRGTLAIRRHPKEGLDILVFIEKGQITCRSYSGCEVGLVFDDDQPVFAKAWPPRDHATTAFFLANPKRFEARIAKAEKMLVQFDTFRQGSPILEFDVKGFDPAKLK